jgi:hypothetical protein
MDFGLMYRPLQSRQIPKKNHKIMPFQYCFDIAKLRTAVFWLTHTTLTKAAESYTYRCQSSSILAETLGGTRGSCINPAAILNHQEKLYHNSTRHISEQEVDTTINTVLLCYLTKKYMHLLF